MNPHMPSRKTMPSLQDARLPHLYVLSGAGLSAESGIATYRSGHGIWSRFSPDQVGNFRTWRKNRGEIFGFFNDRLLEVRAASPNAAHRLLAGWQRQWGADRVHLITQNVDDLLERAGAADVIHLHGDFTSLVCTGCRHRFAAGGESLDPGTACPLCGKVEPVKPGVVLFGEDAPMYAKLTRMTEELRPQDIIVAVGTSFMVVTPYMFVPFERYARNTRNVLVDPNPQCTDLFGVVEVATATVGLTAIAESLTSIMNGDPGAEFTQTTSLPVSVADDPRGT